MKRMWEKVKETWREFWFVYEDEETLQIGSYGLAVSYDSGDFRIDIEYVSE